MSRSTKTISNPCTKFLTWKSKMDDDGKIVGCGFKYYDKMTKANIDVPFPFEFVILDPNLVIFKGYNEKKKSGVWSNEVKLAEHEVNLRNQDGTLMTFKKKDYKNNKEELEGFYAKYTQSVYIGVKVDSIFEIWNLQLSGAALTGGSERDASGRVVNPDEINDGWFSFLKTLPDMYNTYIKVEDFKIKRKGVTKYTVPIYEKSKTVISSEDNKELDRLDNTLQNFFNFYFNNKFTEDTEEETHTEEKEDFDY